HKAQRVSTAHFGSSLGAMKGKMRKFIMKGKASKGAIKISQGEFRRELFFMFMTELYFEEHGIQATML
ncbi:MAG: hypothetical protein Q9M44_06495, partial [Ghiorsea sp.]|nr:hypothetical protein [Ghiorsea sp.]